MQSIILMLLSLSCSDPDSIKGIWIVDAVHPSNYPGMSKEELDDLIGKKMSISDSLFEFRYINYHDATFSIDSLKTNEMFPVFRIGAREIGITSNRICILKIFSQKARMDYSLIIDKNQIIFPMDGILIFLVKKD